MPARGPPGEDAEADGAAAALEEEEEAGARVFGADVGALDVGGALAGAVGAGAGAGAVLGFLPLPCVSWRGERLDDDLLACLLW